MNDFIDNLIFVFQRFTWLSALDMFLVTVIFFVVLLFLRNTQAMVLLRGAIMVIVVVSLVTAFFPLPAFTWLIANALPTLLLAIPVIFAGEIRRALERLGRAGLFTSNAHRKSEIETMIETVVRAAGRLSSLKHGALIVIQRFNHLEEYIETGVAMGAILTPELLLQIFYPNTPLHDGAVIIAGNQLMAATCVMPLSASGVFTQDRKMGLRHRAALGTSEVSDSVSVVVSEETGAISITTGGRMITRLDPDRLQGILWALFKPDSTEKTWFTRVLNWMRIGIPEAPIREKTKNQKQQEKEASL